VLTEFVLAVHLEGHSKMANKFDPKIVVIILIIAALYVVIAKPNFSLFALTTGGNCQSAGTNSIYWNNAQLNSYCISTDGGTTFTSAYKVSCSGTTAYNKDLVSCGGSCTGSGSTLKCGGTTTPPPTLSPTCTNECTSSGTKVCSGSGYKTCGNYDTDSCLEYSSAVACTSGTCTGAGVCGTATISPPSTGTSQCSVEADCCKDGGCGALGLWKDLSLKSATCSGNDLVATNYWDYGCPYVNGLGVCEHTVKSGRVIKTCQYGCELTGTYGAQCKAAPVVVPTIQEGAPCTGSGAGTRVYQTCMPGMPNQEWFFECVNGKYVSQSLSCEFSTNLNGLQSTCSGTKCTIPTPVACTNFCTAGKTCDGSYISECKDWDANGCVEKPTDAQKVLCPYGCTNGVCNSAGTCQQGDSGFPYCSSNKIIQAYKYLSGTTCTSGTRTLTVSRDSIDGDCTAQNAQCVQGGTGVVSCVKQTCSVPKTPQCVGGKEIHTFTAGTYPTCTPIEKTVQVCSGTTPVCSDTSGTPQCVASPPNPYSCEITNTKPIKIALTPTTVFGAIPTQSIISISPTTTIVNQNEDLIVKSRETVNNLATCSNPMLHVKAVPRNLVVAYTIYPTPDLGLIYDHWYPIVDINGAVITTSPQNCVNREQPINFELHFASDKAGTIYDVAMDVVCPSPITVAPASSATKISKDTQSVFSFTVKSGTPPPPVIADKCDQCNGASCTQSKCTSLGACQYIPVKVLGVTIPGELSSGTCEFAKDITNLACNKDTDCPSPRCIHSIDKSGVTYNVEALISGGVCKNKVCTWNSVTNCAETGKLCSESLGRCEAAPVYSMCMGTFQKDICDDARWDGTSWVCAKAPRICRACTTISPATNAASTPKATAVCDVPVETCGNSAIDSGEQCDKAGPVFVDSKSPTQTLTSLDCAYYRPGFYKSGNAVTCTASCQYNTNACQLAKQTCGDGLVNDGTGSAAGNEQCDDKNTANGDGCSSACLIENGWSCDIQQPSVCTRIPNQVCADGTPVGKCNIDGEYCAESKGQPNPSGLCCSSSQVWNPDTETCDNKIKPNCVSGQDIKRCKDGQQQICDSTNFWKADGTVCSAALCTLSGCVGCIQNSDCVNAPCTTQPQGTCVRNTCSFAPTCPPPPVDCVANPCATGCSRATMTAICGYKDPDYKLYTNICEATSAGAARVASTYCAPVTCPAGKMLIFNQCTDTALVIGGVVVIALVAFLAFGGLGGGGSTTIARI
jgi:cysteine-rich repeat protein